MADTIKQRPKQGKKHRKHGRNKRKPCNMRYLSQKRRVKNKARRAARRQRELEQGRQRRVKAKAA